MDKLEFAFGLFLSKKVYNLLHYISNIKIKFTFSQRGKFYCSIFSSTCIRTQYNHGKCFQGFIISEVEGLAILRWKTFWGKERISTMKL